jgi:4-amino-4-deoxy-L-arabinose transferase-like glycosyltransferase
METGLAEPALDSKPQWRRRLPKWPTVAEVSVFLVFTVFFLLYGVVPLFGGAGMGLVGADEPRYSQIAHEMLDRFNSVQTLKERISTCPTSHRFNCIVQASEADLKDRLGACVTPYLYGRPWLEKPALYYWRAMFLFQDFGVHDWSARLPSTTFAFIMAALIYVHMRRFRPGGHLDAALITVACAGIIGFARGASTDMQMAAPLAIGLLGWYAWYETGSKFWLYDIYFFTGLATLAKGPVAPFLAALILVAFAGLRRQWNILIRTLWWPGIVLYFAMVLPWFIAVQHQNPTFFREFFLEHNLQRFATDRYQHEQPFWYYLVVVLLAVMPWTVVALKALVDGIQTSFAEWRLRYTRNLKPVNRTGDAFPEFLVLWALIPIVFFSFSQSKLPGYILPSIPPMMILTGDYLFRRRKPGLDRWVLAGHAVVCAAMTLTVFTLPWFVAHGHQMPPAQVAVPAALAALGTALLIVVVTKGFGVARLRLATTGVLAVLLLFLYGMGPVFFVPQVSASKQVINLLDRTYSARQLADRLAEFVPPDGVVAVFRVRRDTEYGLSFYRNREVVNYDEDGVPDGQHLLVARMTGRKGVDLHTSEVLEDYLAGRQYSPLFSWPEQGLEVYLVGAR